MGSNMTPRMKELLADRQLYEQLLEDAAEDEDTVNEDTVNEVRTLLEGVENQIKALNATGGGKTKRKRNKRNTMKKNRSAIKKKRKGKSAKKTKGRR